MAIQFARVKYVSRKTGGNACHKAAYQQREKIECERTGQVFNFRHKTDLSYHEIILPKGVSEKFKDSSVLWNTVEYAERRSDSQVAKESVIALPDDKIITHEDRIELSRRYAEVMFVSKGLAAQIDIHAPHEGENNWHAHFLATTRGFSKDGESLSIIKARESDPTIRKGYIKEETTPGEIWSQIQNAYFKEKGIDLTVDQIGIVAQEHMGPVRMRAHLTDIVERSNLLKEANEQSFRNPGEIIRNLTEKSSIFDLKQLDHFMKKFVKEEDIQKLRNKVLNHKSLVPLFDSNTQKETGFFTTKEVRLEEEKILRFSDRINQNGHKKVSNEIESRISSQKGLSEEQDRALRYVISGTQGLSLVQGRAGTGKSYTMNAVREAYESSGYKVIGMAPTNAVAKDMQKDGFDSASTVHKFLFGVRNNKIQFPRNSVVIVDEAAMLGNKVLVELFHLVKEKNCKLVMFGDSKQLSSVERGGMFDSIAQKHGSVVLQDVRRQKVEWQKRVSELMGEGSYRQAINILHESKAIHWGKTKEDILSSLVSEWAKDYKIDPNKERLVLANRNVDVDVLNRAIRDIRIQNGHVDARGYELTTARGPEIFSKNDRVAFTVTDKDLGITSGSLGVIESLTENECKVKFDNDKNLIFDPTKYHGLKLGYAVTTYKSQGKTITNVYALHDKYANSKLSYINLSRQERELKVFVNTQETKTLEHLISQVSRDSRNISSLEFMTADQVQRRAMNTNSPMMKVKDTLAFVVTAIQDKFHRNDDFYRLPKQVSSNSQNNKLKIVDQSYLLKEEGDPSTYIVRRTEGLNKPSTENDVHSQKNNSISEIHQKQEYTTNIVRSEMDKDAVKQELINNLEGIVSSLNQTKLHSRTQYDERYGNNGSLRIFTIGERRGTFDCYESDIRGGDIFSLISYLKGHGDFKDALQWGRDYLGGAFRDAIKTIKVQPEITKTPEASKSNWKQICPAPESMKLPTAQEIVANKWLNQKLENGTIIEDIYAYKNQDGSLNFGVYRLRHADGSKGILPLTMRENDKGFQAWQWKGLEGQKPLYGLEKIGAHPDRDILIVEGEKTANAAQKLFPEYTVLTWSSGAGAVSRSDWSSLQGKNVVIWPDNDQNGIKAGEKITDILTEVNKNCEKSPIVSMVKIPDNFKEKWDLADEFPQGWNKDKAKALIDQTLGKTISRTKGIDQKIENPNPEILRKREGVIAYFSKNKYITQLPTAKQISLLEKATDLVFEHAHVFGSMPNSQKAMMYLSQADYELKNMDKNIRYSRVNIFKEKYGNRPTALDEPKVMEIAGRMASLEGRIYRETIENNEKKTPEQIFVAAKEQLDKNDKHKIHLVQQIAADFCVTKEVAQVASTLIIHQQERMGNTPHLSSVQQIDQSVAIAKDVIERFQSSEKTMDSYPKSESTHEIKENGLSKIVKDFQINQEASLIKNYVIQQSVFPNSDNRLFIQQKVEEKTTQMQNIMERKMQAEMIRHQENQRELANGLER